MEKINIIDDQASFRAFLNKRYSEIKDRNPSFSLRSFSRKLKVGSGALSEILSGKRRVTKDKASEILDLLSVTEAEKGSALKSFLIKEEMDKGIAYERYDHTVLAPEENWISYAVLSLVKLDDFVLTYSSVAKRLNVDIEKAQSIVDYLFDSSILYWCEDGRARRSSSSVQTVDNVSSEKLKKIHEQNMNLAKRSLYQDNIDVRDFTSMTLPVCKTKIEVAKYLIRKFQDDFSVLVGYESNSVYKLNVQFFPLSREV
jgi:uncharacterized protein (TIGR02147 family)